MKKAQIVSLVLCAAFIALAFSCASGAPASQGSWEWLVNGDEDNGGSSTITMTEETQEGLPAHSFKGNITNQYEYGFVNVKLMPDEATLEQLKQAKAISFRVLGDGEPYAVKITTSDVSDYAYFEYRFDTVEGQPMTIIVPVEYLMQPSWGKAVAPMVNTNLAQFVEYQTTRNGAPGPYEFKLWDFRVHTKGVPKEKDILPKGAAKAAAAPAAPKGIGGDFGAIDVILTDNFEYGDNYQAVMSDKRLFNGHKIAPGENYTLKITYTASRDLENVVEVGLVDTTPAANYWRGLTFKAGTNTGDPDGMAVIKQSKAGEVVSTTIKFTTVVGATSTSGLANALVFSTKGEGRKGAKGSGKQKAVTFKFTEFVFTQD
jgi:hypothetical protein